MGSPPGPVAGGAPRGTGVARLAPVHRPCPTPSRLATRNASPNSPSACGSVYRTGALLVTQCTDLAGGTA